MANKFKRMMSGMPKDREMMPMPKGMNKVEKVMHEYKEGELKMGKGKKRVKSRRQAIAIGLSEQRKAEKKY